MQPASMLNQAMFRRGQSTYVLVQKYQPPGLGPRRLNYDELEE